MLNLLLTMAHAATLAVVPLDAAPGEPHPGLGQALAGMMVTDLANLESVDLVERARLDALLDELALADGAFMDPATAQQLGQGLGAQHVVVGDYAVVEGTLVINARVVDVETGSVLKSATASGPVADFVSVEKEVMEALVEGLELELTTSARRKLLMETPTEQFDALTAFGEGLHLQDEGDLEAAQQAYARAIQLDPEFEVARDALAQVRAELERFKSTRQRTYDTVYAAMNDAVLAKYAAGGTDRVGLGMRWMALENEGRDCERYQEMRAYLDAVDWRIHAPDDLGDRFEQAIQEDGFREYADDTGGPEIAYTWLDDRSEDLWEGGLPYFLTGDQDLDWWDVLEPSSGLVWSLTVCFEPTERLAQADDIQAQLRKRGLHTQTVDGLPLDIWMALYWAWMHWEIGTTPAFSQRMARLLERVEVTDARVATEEQIELEAEVLRHVEHAIEMAASRDVYHRSLMGLTADQVLAFAQAVLDRDATVLRLDDKDCKQLVRNNDIQAEVMRDLVQGLDQDRDYRHHNDSTQNFPALYGPLRDLGCVVGQPATVTSHAQAVAVGQSFLDDAGTCDVGNLRRAIESPPSIHTSAWILGEVHTLSTLGCQ